MKLEQLGKKLRREAVTNPKKAALLGLVTVLALYFWAPLLRGWFGGDKANAEATTETAPATVAVGVPTAGSGPTATDKPAAAKISWQQVVEWMHKDPRTMTAPALTLTRDPFQTPERDKAEKTAEDAVKAKPPVIAPTAAGLVLTSTIIGPERRVVQINGKSYSVGQIIEAAKDKDPTATKYKLIEISPRRAVLEADGERFELTIPEPSQSDKIQLLGAVSGR